MVLYKIAIKIYFFLVRISSLTNRKAAQFIEGRKNWESKLKNNISNLNDNPKVWIHCASLGEFEQGRPLIEYLKNQFPNYKIILSFFSPSGYEAKKTYAFADLICYLPEDSKNNASRFLDISKPNVIIFVKYEFWLFFLKEIKNRKIPCFLVSGTFRKEQLFFKWYGNIFRKGLESFTHFFLQDQNSQNLLTHVGFQNSMVTGDTRFDRVIEISKMKTEFKSIEDFTKNHFVIIAGSSWEKEEDYVLKSIYALTQKEKKIKLIVAPHEINNQRINKLKKKINLILNTAEVAQFSNSNFNIHAHILIIDCIGILSQIYRYGNFAVVGGGFTSGIHNILEPLVYKIPVAIGPKYTKYNEAVKAVEIGICHPFTNEKELQKEIEFYLNKKINQTEFNSKAEEFFTSNANASKKIISFLIEKKNLYSK